MRRHTFLKSALLAATATIGSAAALSTRLDDASPSPPPTPRAVAAGGPDLPDYAEIHRLLSGEEPITWVFTGDSITQGAFFTNGWRHYVQHFEERVRWELLRKWDFVINTGVSAERSEHILADYHNRVTRFVPAIVSLMIGTNDATSGPAGREAFRSHVE
ncbi:MAG: SGNH/GDSL hydrolase family protein, partial [Stackebrandtia sp.]